MPEIASSDFCRALCCLLGRNVEKTPLMQTIATSSRKRPARAQNSKQGSNHSIPSTRKTEHNVAHTASSSQRQLIINELVETERRYVERLKLLDVQFLQVLLRLESNCDPLRKLCSQILMLKKYHSVLLENLLAGRSVPSVFNKTGDYLKLTQDYHYLNSEVSGIIEKFSHQSKKFMESIKKNELMYQVELNSLLIEPIQSIPRYELLLESLVSNTPKAHPGFWDLKKVFKKILTSILKLNEAESSYPPRTMGTVYQKIRGRGSSLQAPPSRKFVRKNLFWWALKGENLSYVPPLRVRAFLFTDCISICDGRKIGRSHKFLDEIRLCDISFLEFVHEPNISLKKDNISSDLYGIELSANGHKKFGLYLSNRTYVKTWFELIMKYREENAKINNTSRTSIKNVASTQIHPDLQYGTMSNSMMVGPWEVTSNYGSISKCDYALPKSTYAESLEIIRNKSLSGSGSLAIDHDVDHTSSSNESDHQTMYTTTSMFENLKQLAGEKNCKDLKVSVGLPPTSSVDHESICE